MARTTSDAVKGVLLDDYGPRADGTPPDLTPFIDMASALVDQVVACATARGVTLPASQQELIERNLAAHFYVRSDRIFRTKSTGGASASFVLPKGGTSDDEPYRANAIEMDTSGCLNAILNRQSAGAVWLGKRPSEQTPFWERD